MVKVIFSDIDGTCVHYQDNGKYIVDPTFKCDDGRIVMAKFDGEGQAVSALLLPPSTSGAQGIISTRTIELYAAIRAMGIKLVFISGCRCSTLIQRLPFLPAADAYVCESGGRIFYPDTSLPTALALREDMKWRSTHAFAAGDAAIADLSPEEKAEFPLWQQFCTLTAAGLKVDARNYTTAFRVKLNRDEWHAKYENSLPPELSTAENLGAIDLYPITSGKKNVAMYLMERFQVDRAGHDAVFMCDDDNDIELAMAVSKAFLPSITSESMRKAVAGAPEKFYVAKKKSVFATEEILQLLFNYIISPKAVMS